MSIVVLEDTDAASAATDDLTNEELGALTRLQCAMARRGGSIRNDPWLIARLSRAGTRWRKIRNAVTSKLVATGDSVTSIALGKIENWGDPSIRVERVASARGKGTHSPAEWQSLVAVFGGCVNCGVAVVTKDHIEAIAVGGCDCIANLQPLCSKCNSSKSTANIDFRNQKKPGWVVEFLATVCLREL